MKNKIIYFIKFLFFFFYLFIIFFLYIFLFNNYFYIKRIFSYEFLLFLTRDYNKNKTNHKIK